MKIVGAFSSTPFTFSIKQYLSSSTIEHTKPKHYNTHTHTHIKANIQPSSSQKHKTQNDKNMKFTFTTKLC